MVAQPYENGSDAEREAREYKRRKYTVIDGLRYFAGNRMPADFALVYGQMSFDECGNWAGYNFRIMPREPHVLIAAIENLSQTPIKMSGYRYAKVRDTHIRLTEQEPALDAEETEKRLSLRLLRPGEKFILPLAMELRFPTQNRIYKLMTNSQRSVLNARFIHRRIQDFRSDESLTIDTTDYGNRAVKFSKLQRSFQSPSAPNLSRNYLFGPELHLRSVLIEGEWISVRPPANEIQMVGGYQGLSCPRLQVYDQGSAGWNELGHVLVGANSKEQKRTDRIKLQTFGGKIKIIESEPELSFIDKLTVIAHLKDGQKIKLHNDNEKLSSVDGRLETVHYGESVILNYEDLPSKILSKVEKYTVEITGFYLPYISIGTADQK